MKPQELTPTDFMVWRPAHAEVEIRYALPVFQDIDYFVTEGYRRIPHGGLETGGVLYGRRQGAVVEVEAYRPIACDHSQGPSFILSARDIAGLESLLAERDPDLEGLQVVGWFIGHTRSGLMLLERELELFARYFPEPGQITVLVKPEKFKPTVFAVAVRGSGPIERDLTPTAIILPLPGRNDARETPLIESIPAQAPEPVTLPEARTPEVPRQTAPASNPQAPPPPPRATVRFVPDAPLALAGESAVATPPPAAARELARRDAPVAVEPAIAPLPAPISRPRASAWWLALVGILLAAVLGAGAYWVYLHYFLPPVPLRVSMAPDELLVYWPPEATSDADQAEVVVRERDASRVLLLTREQMNSAQIKIPSRELDVSVTLRSHFRTHDEEGAVRVLRAIPAAALPKKYVERLAGRSPVPTRVEVTPATPSTQSAAPNQ